MRYIKGGRYPISEADIRAENPNTSFPLEMLPQHVIEFGYEPVQAVEPPVCDPAVATLIELFPEYTGNGFVQRWSVEPLADTSVQAVMWQRIKARRDKLRENGVKVGADWFHTDTLSRTQLIGLTLMGANLPAGLQWKTMDNSYVAMTPALVAQIFQAIAVADTTNHAVAEQHRLGMLAADTPAAYDFSAGWMETHQ